MKKIHVLFLAPLFLISSCSKLEKEQVDENFTLRQVEDYVANFLV